MANEVATKKVEQYSIMTISQEEIQGLIAANVGRNGVSPFMLERVKIPAGGGLFWTVPTLDGEVPVKEVEGIIIHFRDLRAYWSRRPGEDGSAAGGPPDCLSEDALVGRGRRFDGDVDEAHDCLNCRFSRFGSDPKGGKGQACGARKAIFLLRQDSILPVLFMLPATSLQQVERFFVALLSYRMPFYGCVVRIGLEQRPSTTGIIYSRAVLSQVRKLGDDERARVEALRKVLVPALDRTRIRMDDEASNGGATRGSDDV